MVNTLYLPELREMLAAGDAAQLREFCTALHPGHTADFMEGLTPAEAWQVLLHAELPVRAELFGFFDQAKQVEILETADRQEMAALVGQLPPDDRVDMLNEVDPGVVSELLPLVELEERRDILRLREYPEETAGAVMTTEFARLGESLAMEEALAEVRRQLPEVESFSYLYVVDDEGHLRGVLSAGQLIAGLARPEQKISDLMERDIVAVLASDDQEEVAEKVARYDLAAIPVVDEVHHMLGIITHDDVMDVMREEAIEDAQLIAAVAPLAASYMNTPVFTLTWKRGLWLTILFFAALLTAVALKNYEAEFARWSWLVLFIPLIISCGGNSGNQSATLVITALTTGDLTVFDWGRVVRRELVQGLFLGGFLALIGYGAALAFTNPTSAAVIPLTLLLVVVCGTLVGALLPLLFRYIGLDPALMSNPFVAVIIDIVGVVIYMNVAVLLLA